MTTLQDGAIFAGRYRVLRCIAHGGMGAVYEVLHLETERRRALKVMLPHVLQSEDLRERFKREAKVAAHIDSEFIVEVFDAGVDDATQMPFLVMELLKGEELGKRLKRLGRLQPADVAAHVHQAALALDKTHRAAIVHRDLKPENLFLTEREEGPPRIKVLDFGVAKVVAESATAGATQSIGTPLYMAPEQFNPAARLTGAADLYALGMVAFTLLVGKPYWAEEAQGGNIFALANVAMRGPVEPATVRAARRGVALPPTFDAWFARITAFDPSHRFPTATEASRALAEALGVGRAPSPSLVEAAPFAHQAPAAPLPAYPPAHHVVTPAGQLGVTPPSAMSTPPPVTPAPFSAPASAPASGTITLPPSVLSTAPATALITAPATTAPAQPSPPASRTGLVAAVAIAGVALLGGGIYLIAGKSPAPAPSAAASAAPPAPPAPVVPPTPPAKSEAPVAATSQPAPTTTPAPAETATAAPSAEHASAPPPASTGTKPAAPKPHGPSRYSRD